MGTEVKKELILNLQDVDPTLPITSRQKNCIAFIRRYTATFDEAMAVSDFYTAMDYIKKYLPLAQFNHRAAESISFIDRYVDPDYEEARTDPYQGWCTGPEPDDDPEDYPWIG